MLCAKFKKDSSTEIGVMGDQDLGIEILLKTDSGRIVYRVPTGPYFREKSLFSIVALPALEKSLLLNIFDRSPGKVLIFNRCDKT